MSERLPADHEPSARHWRKPPQHGRIFAYYLFGSLALAAVTGFIGYLGIRDWDGETGGNVALLLVGLPMWASLIALSDTSVPIPVAFCVGFGLQWVCCLVPVALVRLLIRLVRSPRFER